MRLSGNTSLALLCCDEVLLFLFCLFYFLQPPFGFGRVGVEFKSLAVVCGGGFGHVFTFAFLAEKGVFGCETFQEFLLLFLLLF